MSYRRAPREESDELLYCGLVTRYGPQRSRHRERIKRYKFRIENIKKLEKLFHFHLVPAQSKSEPRDAPSPPLSSPPRTPKHKGTAASTINTKELSQRFNPILDSVTRNRGVLGINPPRTMRATFSSLVEHGLRPTVRTVTNVSSRIR